MALFLVETLNFIENLYNYYSQEVLVLGLLESEIFKGDIRPNLCVCLFVRFLTRVKIGKNC